MSRFGNTTAAIPKSYICTYPVTLIAYHEYVTPDSLNGAELDYLLSLGWYRMHQDIFTTSHVFHEEFFRVHWLRFPLEQIKHHRSHQRIRKKNRRFRVLLEDLVEIDTQHEELYARYRASIDFNGALSITNCLFDDVGQDRGIYDTKCLSIYDGEKLIAAGYFDLGEQTGASILHCFDPDYDYFSLGKYLVLLTVDYLQSVGYHFYYPGYLVSGDPKMNYKLFLGKEVVQYFDAATSLWRPFDPAILESEQLSDQEKLEVILALTSL